ncbi:unnamed protein product, partial [Hydatigera taeniaeformis]|uniref:C2 DOCK-type domain-containing protein n=1 Tax=Hydatigena taeniaeformis TaxID=6205 RepID=A0A0R3X985_HYDTA
MLAVTNINADNISEGDCHWTPIAWTAVHLSTAVVQMSQETQRSPRRRHFSVSERYLSAERREGQNQQITEAFRRPRLLSDAGDPLQLPLRSRTTSDHRRFSTYASESSPNDLQIREVTGSESTSLPLEDSLSLSRSSTDDLKDSPKMVELNLQLTTRNFFKKDLSTGNHSSEIERTIMEAFKLQSSTPNISPWIHDMLTRVGHAHPLRRLKTFSGQMEVSMTGIIVSPCGLSHHIQRANFRSTEGEDLLTNGSSETRFQEIVEFPTIGRVFPFNFPRSPEFTDEIKVLLPKRLNSSHHLLFTFVHVEISPACDTNESVLGYSWLPILINDQICSGEETLYLTHDQPTSKMAQTIPRHVETLTKDSMESGELNALIKTSFHLRVVPVSSLYQDDDCVASIIHACNFANFEEICGSLSEHDIFSTQPALDSLSSPPPLLVHLQKAKLNYLVLHLVPIMDGLLQTLGVCLVQNKTKPSQNLLTLLAFYIHRISKGLSDWEEESTGRNHFICAYLSGIGRSSTDHVLPYLLSGYPMMGLSWFDDVSNYLRGSSEPVTRKLHEELLQCLIAQIATDTPFSRNFCEETLWFFLELLIRTLIVECKINAESASHAFVDSLDVFTREITKSILTRIRLDDNAESLGSTRLVNRAFAFFLQDLLTHLNATHVFRLISTYMQA